MNPELAIKEYFNSHIVWRVERLQSYQHPVTGQIITEQAAAAALLNELVNVCAPLHIFLNLAPLQKAFAHDVKQWLEHGLDQPPTFDSYLEQLVAPQDGQTTFVIAPMLTPNGPSTQAGHRVEAFLARREEPSELLQFAAQFPHPCNRMQSLHLIAGSIGLRDGNCLIFFPECVATAEQVSKQEFAMFFFSKFEAFFRQISFSVGKRLFKGYSWKSEQLTSDEFYRARCVWGYLHDHFHHCGPRPLHLGNNLVVKQIHSAALLEELKVDCQVALAGLTNQIPFGLEVFEFVLLERICRYPLQPDAPYNIDALSGVFLFQWLLNKGGLLSNCGIEFVIQASMLKKSLNELVQIITAIEMENNDEKYLIDCADMVARLSPGEQLTTHITRLERCKTR